MSALRWTRAGALARPMLIAVPGQKPRNRKITQLLLTGPQQAWLADRRRAGHSVKLLAEALGIAACTARRYLARAGLTKPRPARAVALLQAVTGATRTKRAQRLLDLYDLATMATRQQEPVSLDTLRRVRGHGNDAAARQALKRLRELLAGTGVELGRDADGHLQYDPAELLAFVRPALRLVGQILGERETTGKRPRPG